MAKQLSIGSVTVYDHKLKHQHYYSNLKPPISINTKTQFSFTFRRGDHLKTKKRITKNEIEQYCLWKKRVAQQLKQVQESRLIMNNKIPGAGHDDPSNNVVQSYPFIETPVKFEFGDHQYGNQLFREQHREIMYYNINKSSSQYHIYSADDHDIYSLSTPTGMINSFMKDNLF